MRVVLLDGLSRAHALRLPSLSEICSAGQELQLDIGFPTVSLPVQSALWTGMTQQQSGLQYHIGKLPARLKLEVTENVILHPGQPGERADAVALASQPTCRDLATVELKKAAVGVAALAHFRSASRLGVLGSQCWRGFFVVYRTLTDRYILQIVE